MGLNITKEWSEVMTTGSPESDSNQKEPNPEPSLEDCTTPFGKSVKKVKSKLRGVSQDPRSVSEDVDRTPIRVEKIEQNVEVKEPTEESLSESNDVSKTDDDSEAETSGQLKEELLSTPVNLEKQINKLKALAIDPRSPSSGVNRTPIVVESPAPKAENLKEINRQTLLYY